jgi:hypothetical protein
MQFTTKTGCTVWVTEAPSHFGDGAALLTLLMEQPGDGRRSEVVLTKPERKALRRMLRRRAFERL